MEVLVRRAIHEKRKPELLHCLRLLLSCPLEKLQQQGTVVSVLKAIPDPGGLACKELLLPLVVLPSAAIPVCVWPGVGVRWRAQQQTEVLGFLLCCSCSHPGENPMLNPLGGLISHPTLPEDLQDFGGCFLTVINPPV